MHRYQCLVQQTPHLRPSGGGEFEPRGMSLGQIIFLKVRNWVGAHPIGTSCDPSQLKGVAWKVQQTFCPITALNIPSHSRNLRPLMMVKQRGPSPRVSLASPWLLAIQGRSGRCTEVAMEKVGDRQ